MFWRRLTILSLGVVSCGVLGACGGNAPTVPAPTGAGASPPATGPTDAGFLHVQANRELTTYRIDATTGRLQLTTTQKIGDVHALTGEPQGRYVYMAYGPRTAQPPYNEPLPSIVAYAPDAHDGTLAAVSEARSNPIFHSSWPVSCEWTSVFASANRVYAMWVTNTYHDPYYDYVTHAVGNDGQLGPAYDFRFDEFGGGNGIVDARSNVLYKEGLTGVTAHAIGSDGHLTQTGWSNLCVASEAYPPTPLVAVRGFLLARAYVYRQSPPYTVCSYQGPRLAPRANLGFDAIRAEAFVPDSDVVPAQLAIPTTIPARSGQPIRYELQLFAMSPDGHLQLQDTKETPGATASELLFHPARRFVYATVGSRLLVYSIEPEGRLTLVEDLAGAGGRMAVTTPNSVIAGAEP